VRRDIVPPSLIDAMRAAAANPVLVGIDGPGGAGKTTLARLVKRHAGMPVTIVEGDDFYRTSAERSGRAPGVGEAFDWRRLHDEVLLPLRAGRPARYQRYDWSADRLTGWTVVQPQGAVIVEGVYSLRKELRTCFDVTVWVDAPAELRLARGLERDGEDARDWWLEWMAEEERYRDEQRPDRAAMLRLDGSSASFVISP
jgi:uridine kinase